MSSTKTLLSELMFSIGFGIFMICYIQIVMCPISIAILVYFSLKDHINEIINNCVSISVFCLLVYIEGCLWAAYERKDFKRMWRRMNRDERNWFLKRPDKRKFIMPVMEMD